MTDEASGEVRSPLEEFIDFTNDELEQVGSGLKEISMLVEQSQGEVDKLAQRNAQITAQLHQIQTQFETIPREDIRSSYENAQDTQQRLFTMRGQLEKLQSDQSNLKRYKDFLSKTLQVLETGASQVKIRPQDGRAETVIEQIIGAQEDERRKISRQIHDGPAQSLSNFILQTEIALRLFDVDTEQAKAELQNLKNSASTTFSSVRDFIFDLRPMMLDDLGLVPTVRRYTEAFKEKTGLDINVVITGSERRLEPHREVLATFAITLKRPKSN
jgi:two-component system sensor histidine kinase DegS